MKLADSNAHQQRQVGLASNHYTCFIVPFGYRLLATTEDTTYHPDDGKGGCLPGVLDLDQLRDDAMAEGRKEPDQLAQRHRYLLPGTRLTLFERAAWFRLGGAPQSAIQGCLSFNPAGHDQVSLSFRAAAELVLFEWEDALHAPPNGELAAIGLLLLTVVLVNGTAEKVPSLHDLLNLNERLRYLEEPYPEVRSRLTMKSNDTDTLQITSPQPGDHPVQESDYWEERWKPLIEQVVEDSRGERRKVEVCASKRPQHPGFYPDDRAFVYTSATVSGSRLVRNFEDGQDAGPYEWKTIWHAMVDVDGQSALTRPITRYQQCWLAERTYGRWLELGALYGFTDFSAALLMILDENPYLAAAQHFRRMYLDQMLLLLYQRTALYRFSSTISTVTAEHLRALKGGGKWPVPSLSHFRELRRQFTFMTNLYQFPVFSVQYQGADLYRLARQQLELDQMYGEVKNEIAATDDYLSQEDAERINRSLAFLQHVGLPVAVIATALTAFGALLTLLQLQRLGSNWSTMSTHLWPPWQPWPDLPGSVIFMVLGILSVAGIIALVYLVRCSLAWAWRALRRDAT